MLRHLLVATLLGLLLCSGAPTAQAARPAAGPRRLREVVYFAWRQHANSRQLVVPESDGTSLPRVGQLTVAFCSSSGKHPVKFAGHQNLEAEQSTTAMPLDVAIPVADLRGARFSVVEGQLRRDDTCLITDESFASSHRLLTLRDSPDDTACEEALLKRLGRVARPPRRCRKGAHGEELTEVRIETTGKRQRSFVGFLTRTDQAVVELGNPDDEYGPTVLILDMAFLTGDGHVLIATTFFHHETAIVALKTILAGKLRDLVSEAYYNSAGG
jgi:hypothetical protein